MTARTGRPRGSKDKQPRKRIPSIASLMVRSENEQRAYAMQQKLIEQYLPGLSPLTIMVIDDNQFDVRAREDCLLIGERALESNQVLAFVLLHGLIHKASQDPEHGERYLRVEGMLGLTGTTQNLSCFAADPAQPTAELRLTAPPAPLLPQALESSSVQVGVPLENIAKRLHEVCREYYLRVGGHQVRGREQFDELSRLFNLYEHILNENRAMAGIGVWKDCTDAPIREKPVTEGEVSAGELIRAFDCSRTVIWRWQKKGFPTPIRRGIYNLGAILELIKRATGRETATIEPFAGRQRICREYEIDTEVFDRWRRHKKFPKSVFQSRWSLPAIQIFAETVEGHPRSKDGESGGPLDFLPAMPAIGNPAAARTILEFFKSQVQQTQVFIDGLQAMGLRDFSDVKGYPEKPYTPLPHYDDDKRGPMLGRMRRERIEFEAGIRE